MKSMKRKVAKAVEKFTKNMAIMACGAASSFGGHQIKEPKNIYKK